MPPPPPEVGATEAGATGVTLLETTEACPVPTTFVAATVNVEEDSIS